MTAGTLPLITPCTKSGRAKASTTMYMALWTSSPHLRHRQSCLILIEKFTGPPAHITRCQ
ncbi:hypothetical protein [Streptomyces sp. NPDC093094]|uniref:hypothetical protein n=1 Tax=Streptomyces sp. NPDC093094 TaxID=3366026 RepID=UPI00380E6C78